MNVCSGSRSDLTTASPPRPCPSQKGSTSWISFFNTIADGASIHILKQIQEHPFLHRCFELPNNHNNDQTPSTCTYQ
jgi:hypothetical protein